MWTPPGSPWRSILYTADALEAMTEEEKAAIAWEFRCHLYSDLSIRLEDIFGDLL